MKLKMNVIVLQCAVRYALGRKTYIVNCIVNELIEHWDSLEKHLKRNIKYDINIAIKNNDYGMETDKEQWLKILKLEVE